METLCVKKCWCFRGNISTNLRFNWKKGKHCTLLDYNISPKVAINYFVPYNGLLSSLLSEEKFIGFNIIFQVYKDLVDFDNHLDDITQDYLNVQMNMVIDQAL